MIYYLAWIAGWPSENTLFTHKRPGRLVRRTGCHRNGNLASDWSTAFDNPVLSNGLVMITGGALVLLVTKTRYSEPSSMLPNYAPVLKRESRLWYSAASIGSSATVTTTATDVNSLLLRTIATATDR